MPREQGEYRCCSAGGLRDGASPREPLRASGLRQFGASKSVFADDYARMLAADILLGEGEPFDTLLDGCARIYAGANTRQRKDT